MILIALGSNLPGRFDRPEDNLSAALEAMPGQGITVVRCSRIWTTKPVPVSDQPDYSNAVAIVETSLGPEELLHTLLEIERGFGRERDGENRNAARTLDLDVLAYNDRIMASETLDIPHPRLHERVFVLGPLCEIAPGWQHPVLGKTAKQLLSQQSQS